MNKDINQLETVYQLWDLDVTIIFKIEDTTLHINAVFILSGLSYSHESSNTKIKISGIKSIIDNELLTINLSNNDLVVDLSIMSFVLHPVELNEIDLINHKLSLLMDRVISHGDDNKGDLDELELFNSDTDGFFSINGARQVVYQGEKLIHKGKQLLVLDINRIYCNGNTNSELNIVMRSKQSLIMNKIINVKGMNDWNGYCRKLIPIRSDGTDVDVRITLQNKSNHTVQITREQSSFTLSSIKL